MPAIHLQLL